MKKIISVYVEGDLELLLNNWDIPDGVEYNQESTNSAMVIFRDNYVEYFKRFKLATDSLGTDVIIDPLFRATDFVYKDCRDAKLLKLRAICQQGIGLTSSYTTVQDLQSRDRIDIFSHSSLSSWVVLLCSNLFLFHSELVTELRDRGLVKGLLTLPTYVEIENTEISNEWLWITSRVDLGKPLTQHRFLDGFQRGAWDGEDFCTSSFYKSKTILVSQPVFKFLRSLPKEKKGSIRFEPVEFLG